MRLAVEVTTCTPTRAGVGYYAQHLVDALLETRGPRDEVALLTNVAPAPELAERWAPHLYGPACGGVRAVWTQTAVPRLLAELGADLAVFPNYVVPLASPCATLAVIHDLAVLRTPQHFTRRKQLLMRPLLAQSLASATVVGTVSDASLRDLTDLLRVDPRRIVLLPGAPHPSCGTAGPAEVDSVRARYGLRRPYVLTVGTLEPRKNLLSLLRAFDTLDASATGAAERHELVVVGGRGWRDEQIHREVRAREASGRVRWLGYVPERDLVALYTGARVFVYASSLEGFGLPVVEAMACGAPVIATDVTALREVSGGAARLVAPEDPAALAEAIGRVLRDPAEGDALRAAGSERAKSFRWERTAEALWRRARDSFGPRVRDALRTAPAHSAPVASPLPAPLGSPPAGLTSREWALLATVAYADLFDAPFPVALAPRACIGASIDEPSARALALGPALRAHLSLDPRGYLVLVGRASLLARLPAREAQSDDLFARNRALLRALAALPYVRMLGISGGLAHKNPGEHRDVDLFVITEAGRAYTAYSLLVLASRLTGTRGVMCPNYLIDERELAIAYHRDLFTAHQLVSVVPLAGARTFEAFWRANEAWAREFFPGVGPTVDGAAPSGRPLAQRALEAALAPGAGVLEGALRFAWRIRLRKRAARAPRADIVLADGILKLHLSDHRQRVLARFTARLDALRDAQGALSSSEAR